MNTATATMKIELRNVTFCARLSEETNAFAAVVYIDGKKACEVSNDGHGGPDRYSDWDVEKRINAYAKTLPPVECFGTTLEQNADMLIGDLFNAWLVERAVKKDLKTRIVFEKLDGTYGATKTVTQAQRDLVAKKPEDALAKLKAKRFIADLAEAVKVYDHTFKPKH
jgi:hypothetical protein